MNKQQFIDALREKLSSLPPKDVEERLSCYVEMIDDQVEEGISEEEAVSNIGSVEKIAEQIAADISLTKREKKKTRQKRTLRAWEIVLIALGSPIWLSLAIAAFAVIFSLYVVLWSVIISFWAVFASFIGCALGGIAVGVLFIILQNALSGISMIGAGLVCAGLAIFTFFGCKAATLGSVWLTKKISIGIKNCFVKKGGA